jgi:hypothetical protein
MNLSTIPPNISGFPKRAKMEMGPQSQNLGVLFPENSITPNGVSFSFDFGRGWNPTKDFTGIIPINYGDSRLNQSQVATLATYHRPENYGGHFEPEGLAIFSLKSDEIENKSRTYLIDITTLNCMLACEDSLNSITDKKRIKELFTYMGIVQGATVSENYTTYNPYIGNHSIDIDKLTAFSVMTLGRTTTKNYWGVTLYAGKCLGFDLRRKYVKDNFYQLARGTIKQCTHDGYAFQLTPMICSNKCGGTLKERKYEVNGQIEYASFIYIGVSEWKHNYLPHKMDVNDHLSQLSSPPIEINVSRKSSGKSLVAYYGP